MDVSFATVAAPGRPNEDLVIATDEFVVVLDGVTSPPRLATGCVHDPVWLVRTLGSILATGLVRDPRAELRGLLFDAIVALRGAHADTCDLSHPESPSSTVSIVRERGAEVDYLVLCDSTVVLGRHGVITDDRTAAMRGLTRAQVAALRNAPGGFWVASTDPAAAGEALVGSVPRDGLGTVLVCTDGAARLVEKFGRTWPEVLDLVDHGSARDVLAAVRAAERATPLAHGKPHDDATIAVCAFPGSP